MRLWAPWLISRTRGRDFASLSQRLLRDLGLNGVILSSTLAISGGVGERIGNASQQRRWNSFVFGR